MQICEAFDLIAQLRQKDGGGPLCDHPGLWNRKIGEQWEIWVNGHSDYLLRDTMPIPPFHCYVEFNGWPAGTFHPGGGIIAAGELANEAAFILALKEELATTC